MPEETPAVTPPTPPPKKPKFTAKVKRGLFLVRLLTLNALNPDEAPGFTTVRKWKKAQEGDLNAALAWVEFHEVGPV